MKREYSPEELLHKAAAYCSHTEHSVQEVKEKLVLWGAGAADIKQILNHLLSEDYINEKRYSTYFVKDKFRFNKWGRIKIGMALRQKGIGNELIADSLEQIDEEAYEELLIDLLQSKLRGLKFQSEYDRNGKLFRFAQSRGFENKLIESAVRKVGG